MTGQFFQDLFHPIPVLIHVVVEHGDNDGSHDADGTPGSTGSEADSRADDEDDGGQEHTQIKGVGGESLSLL